MDETREATVRLHPRDDPDRSVMLNPHLTDQVHLAPADELIVVG